MGLLLLALVAGTASLGAREPDAREPDALYDELVLRRFELRFEEANWEELLELYYEEQETTGVARSLRADLTVDGVTYPDVGVEYRGFSSYHATAGTRKRPFKITLDAFVEGQHLHGRDSIALNNSFLDASRVSEVLAYHIARKYCVAPHANWVKLFAGTAAGGLDDLGVYVNVERVENTFLRRHYGNDDGHRYRGVLAESDGARFQWLGRGREAYEAVYPLRGGDPATAYRDLIDVLSRLQEAADDELVEALDAVLDLDSALRVLAVNAAVSNFDSFLTGQNYYLYRDTRAGRLTVVPWDMDASFRLNPLFFPYQLWDGHELTRRLLGIPAMRARYVAHLRQIAREELDWERLEPMVSTWQALLEDEVTTSPFELFSHAEFVAAFDRLQITVQHQRDSILRFEGFDLPAARIDNVTHDPPAPDSLTETWVRARIKPPDGRDLQAAFLRYRRFGSFRSVPLLDDGRHHDGIAGDGIYGASIPPQPPGGRVDYFVEAWAMNETVAFSPASAEFRAHGFEVTYLSAKAPFVINELSALNETGPQDEAGDNDDWLELYNDSSGWWSTDGYFLTNDLAVPTLWKLPDLLVPARGFVRVWCDGETEQGFLHASFRLSSEGDQIHLLTPNEDGYRLADSVRFGRQRQDVSTGRACDGGDVFREFVDPTPGRSNGADCRAAGLMLPGDCQADGNVNITDAICMLTYLFLGHEPTAPCESSGDVDAGFRALLDINGDRLLNLSDTVSLLNFLFLSGAAPVLGRDCAALPLCESVCLD